MSEISFLTQKNPSNISKIKAFDGLLSKRPFYVIHKISNILEGETKFSWRKFEIAFFPIFFE